MEVGVEVGVEVGIADVYTGVVVIGENISATDTMDNVCLNKLKDVLFGRCPSLMR
jgi:hypothetical protein